MHTAEDDAVVAQASGTRTVAAADRRALTVGVGDLDRIRRRHPGAVFSLQDGTRQIEVDVKAIVVIDQAAGTAGMTLAERPEPQAAINDAIVEIYAAGFVPTEMAWPSTWADRVAIGVETSLEERC